MTFHCPCCSDQKAIFKLSHLEMLLNDFAVWFALLPVQPYV